MGKVYHGIVCRNKERQEVGNVGGKVEASRLRCCCIKMSNDRVQNSGIQVCSNISLDWPATLELLQREWYRVNG